MKQVVDGDLKSLYIESKEIRYVRIDTKNNLVIIFQNPKKSNGTNVIGYRSKLIGDPTGDFPDAEFKIRSVYEEEMEDEKKIVRDGKLTEDPRARCIKEILSLPKGGYPH